jgi:hypothetical protein
MLDGKDHLLVILSPIPGTREPFYDDDMSSFFSGVIMQCTYTEVSNAPHCGAHMYNLGLWLVMIKHLDVYSEVTEINLPELSGPRTYWYKHNVHLSLDYTFLSVE